MGRALRAGSAQNFCKSLCMNGGRRVGRARYTAMPLLCANAPSMAAQCTQMDSRSMIAGMAVIRYGFAPTHTLRACSGDLANRYCGIY